MPAPGKGDDKSKKKNDNKGTQKINKGAKKHEEQPSIYTY